MKIKCPICMEVEKDDEYKVYTEFYNHLKTHPDWVLSSYLMKLILQIHEKIESLEKHEPQLKQGLGTIESLGQLKALKSLLK